MAAITLVLADDHQIVRQGLKALLKGASDIKLVGEAADGLEAVRNAEKLKPDVLVLDLMMPGMNGLEAARQIIKRSPKTKIVILSMHSNEGYVLEALRAGAVGYVLKDCSSDVLLQSIRTVAAGKRFLSPPISERHIQAYLQKSEGTIVDPYQKLTDREREILQLTSEGMTGNDIAERLFISRRTVETHRANIMHKLGVRNQKEMIRYATQRELLPQDDLVTERPKAGRS